MLFGKKLITAILCIFIFICLEVPVVSAKSAYVISDTQISELSAYKVDGTSLDHQPQADYICESDPVGTEGAIALAIDPNSEFLFVTIEYSNEIEVVNAKTMQ